jgi:hypothetical protein
MAQNHRRRFNRVVTVPEEHLLAAEGRKKWPVAVRRRRKSGGNVIIEAAFTLLPTFAIIFAFIDIGLMMFRWTTLQNAVREGCRYAITFQQQTVGMTTLGQNQSIENVVEQYAMGLVHASDTGPVHIFVNYYDPTTFAASTNIPGNIVKVSVQNVSMNWMMPLSSTYWGGIFYTTSPLTLAVSSADILGGFPVGTVSVPE